MKDPILEEVHRVRDNLAKQFDYDVNKIFEHIRQEQEKDKLRGVKYVSFPPKRPKKEAA